MEIINILYNLADYYGYSAIDDMHFIKVNYMQYILRGNKVLHVLRNINNNM